MTTLITLTPEEVERCLREHWTLMAQQSARVDGIQLDRTGAKRWAFVQWLVREGRLTDD